MKEQRAANDEDEGLACAPLPDGFPAGLREMPLRVVVGLTLTENNCIYRSFTDDFGVESVEQAMTNLLKYEDIFLVYRFSMAGAQPAFSRDVDWSLLRRGDASGIQCRDLISTGAPWNLVSDRTIFEIRNAPTSAGRVGCACGQAGETQLTPLLVGTASRGRCETCVGPCCGAEPTRKHPPRPHRAALETILIACGSTLKDCLW